MAAAEAIVGWLVAIRSMLPQNVPMDESGVLQSVKHSFAISGRGVVLIPDGPWQLDCRTGDSLILISPTGTQIHGCIDGIEHVQVYVEQLKTTDQGIFVSAIRNASEIPAGTIICLSRPIGNAPVIDVFKADLQGLKQRTVLVLDPSKIRGKPAIASDAPVTINAPSGAEIQTRGLGYEGAGNVSAIILPDWMGSNRIERLSTVFWR